MTLGYEYHKIDVHYTIALYLYEFLSEGYAAQQTEYHKIDVHSIFFFIFVRKICSTDVMLVLYMWPYRARII